MLHRQATAAGVIQRLMEHMDTNEIATDRAYRLITGLFDLAEENSLPDEIMLDVAAFCEHLGSPGGPLRPMDEDGQVAPLPTDNISDDTQ